MSLSDTWLRKNIGKLLSDRQEVVKSDRDGLAARLRNGKISFIYRPYFNGKQIKITLGKYPSMSLKQAREKTTEYAAMIAQGIDPRTQIQLQKTQNIEAKSVDDVVTEWFDANRIPAQVRKTYALHMQKTIGGLRAKDIDRFICGKLLQTIGDKYPSLINRAIRILRKSFDRYINTSGTDMQHPCTGLSPRSFVAVKSQARKRVLNHDELTMLLTVIAEGQMALKNKLFLKLLLFYGCRGNELRQTKKAWLDFDNMTWTVPAEFHKTGASTGRDLVRPVLDEIKPLWDDAFLLSGTSEYVFVNLANRFDNTAQVMSQSSVRTLSDSIIRTAAIKHGYGFKHWSVHDLRRTARTNWAGYGSYEVCEKMLGHAIAGSDTYDLYQYQKEMVLVYQQWFKTLLTLGY